MNKDQAKGKLEKAVGKVQEKWGELTGDPGGALKGRAKQVVGAVRESAGDLEEQAGEALGDLVHGKDKKDKAAE